MCTGSGRYDISNLTDGTLKAWKLRVFEVAMMDRLGTSRRATLRVQLGARRVPFLGLVTAARRFAGSSWSGLGSPSTRPAYVHLLVFIIIARTARCTSPSRASLWLSGTCRDDVARVVTVLWQRRESVVAGLRR
jgi:hypothetical protein